MNAIRLVFFRFLRKRLTHRHTGFNRGCLVCMFRWVVEMRRCERNTSIASIVLIVTGFLNETIPFSLFNATQILSIPIRKKTAIVFIVLIVLIVPIVTRFQNEAVSFSLFNATQILSIAIWKTQGKTLLSFLSSSSSLNA